MLRCSGAPTLGAARAQAASRLGLRYKSERSVPVSDFPLRDLNHREASIMTAEMERTTKMPLRSFIAQHRPISVYGGSYPVLKPTMDHVPWTLVPVKQARYVNEGRESFEMLPNTIAKSLGPFNRDAMMSKTWDDFKQGSSSLEEPDFRIESMNHFLRSRFPVLEAHLRNLQDQDVKIVPLTVDQFVGDADTQESLETTSVQRKRKLKMNRHKYRKRLKAQRTKRRRLNS